MAARMPDTLVKLARGGKKRGLREVDIRSIRTGRTLRWKQEAKPGRCGATGVMMVARIGRLTDGEAMGVPLQEEEFYRSVALPAEHTARCFLSYYKLPGGRVRIAVSVPIARRKVDLGQRGHFYYPLKAPWSRTGCAIGVSAPFDLRPSGVRSRTWSGTTGSSTRPSSW